MRRLCAAVLLLPLAAVAAPRQYTHAELGTLLQAPHTQAQRESVGTAASRGDWPTLHLNLDGTAAKSAPDPLLAEYLLRETLVALRPIEAPADIAARVQALTRHAPQALVPPFDPDHGRGHWIAAFDVAAAARGTLRAWQLRDNTQRARQLLRTAPDRLAGFDDAEALATVIDSAPLDLLAALRPQTDSLSTRALRSLALRLDDAVLYVSLFERPADSFVLAGLQDAVQGLPADDARHVLEGAAASDELASAATLALAGLADSAEFLLHCLGDPRRGGSCAQGLAQHPDAVPALIELLAPGRDDLASRRALLALLWMNDRAARETLAAYAADPAMPAARRAEVSGWLR